MTLVGTPKPTSVEALVVRLQAFRIWTVDIGPLVLDVQVDPARAQALLVARLAGVQVLRTVVTLMASIAPMDLAAAGARAQGSIQLVIFAPPQYSALTADLTVQGGSAAPIVFRGQLVSWLATDDPVVFELDCTIGPALTAHTTVRGLAGAQAEMTFFNGSLLLESEAVTQLSPTASFGRILVGNLEIAAGATITLTIPSQVQGGMLVLQAVFPRLPPPSRTFAGVVASWPMP